MPIYKTDALEGKVRLDIFLKENIADVSREKIKKAILSGSILVDGMPVLEPSFRLTKGRTVEADIGPEPKHLSGEQMSLEKVFENEDFVVVDKPPGLVVHPGANVRTGTLAQGLLWDYPRLAEVGHPIRPGIVHRLDKDTSGLLLVAKNNQAFDYAKELFKERAIRKEYRALVEGRLEPGWGVIEKPLALDPVRRRVKVDKDGKYAKTEYKVLGCYQARSNSTDLDVDIYTLVSVILHTGRTHQIRVHFSSLGHPLAGDEVYGAKQLLPGLTRQFLHASRLVFTLPDGTGLDLESPLPQDLQSALSNLELIR